MHIKFKVNKRLVASIHTYMILTVCNAMHIYEYY